MDEISSQGWFLRKHHDGSVFGPISFNQLANWASAAQVAPHDLVSTDQQTWMKAPMVAQLGMDWLVEVTSEHYYGPTTVGAIQEFIQLGDVNGETFVIKTCDEFKNRRISNQRTDCLRNFIPAPGTHPRFGTNVARRTPHSQRN